MNPPSRRESLARLFEARVAAAPDAEAVVCGATRLTAADLDARANALAHRLIAAGASTETPVLVLLERSAETVITLLAIAKAGATYVPLHPAYPSERMEWIRRETGARLAVAHSWDGLTTLQVTGETRPDSPARDIDPRRLAYVMFTSGSTGVPKGVAVTHHNVAAFAFDRLWRGPGHRRVLHHTAPSFDVSMYELWVPLLNGGTVVVAPPGVLDAPTLGRMLRQERLTGVFLTTGLFNVLAEGSPEVLAAVPELWIAGEAASPAAVGRVLAAGGEVHNGYGPTETTVYATAHHVTEPGDVVPIGAPLDGTAAYVLDDALRQVPVGELYLAGDHLARGYLGRPGLTAERFVADPYGPPGTRMYRTGDLVRRLPDGLLDYVGRIDGQVKVRGIRVELGEIDATMARHPAVAQSVTLLREDNPGDKRLVTYLTTRNPVKTDDLRHHAEQALPGYMVPGALVVLDALPLNHNGKVDRDALPAPEAVTSGTAPRTPVEEILRDLFAQVLAVPGVGIDDDFFALGGHSLLAMRVVAGIRSALSVELQVREVFEAPTVAALAVAVEKAKDRGTRPPLVRSEDPEQPSLSFAQHRIWIVDRLAESAGLYTIPLVLRLSGRLDGDALAAALRDVARRHETLRTVFPTLDGRPRQRVLDVVPDLPVTEIDEAELGAAIEREAARPFDLSAEPPVRARLFALRHDPGEHVLVVLLHHIAADGWSMAPLRRDLAVAYAARTRGEAPGWEPLPVRYADYTLWQRDLLGDAADPDSLMSAQTGFWRRALAGLPEELTLPADRPRPPVAGHRGGAVPLRIPPGLHGRLLALARGERATPFMVLQAGLAALLTRLGAGDDIPIGSPVAGRADEALDELVGFFVNTLVLRTDTSGDPSFRELLARVREADLAAYAHQDVPFEHLVEALNPVRLPGRNPLFQVMLALENTPDDRTEAPGLTVSLDPDYSLYGLSGAKCDLLFGLSEGPSGIHGVLQYATDLFDHGTAETIAARLTRLLEAVAADPDLRIGRVELLTAEERHALVEGGNATAVPLPYGDLARLFEARVAADPDAEAVVCGTTRLSATQLNERANALAHRLIAAGAGRETPVLVLLERSADVVATLLAVAKAGATYVPLHPAYPPERMEWIRQETGARLAVTDFWDGLTTLRVTEETRPDNPARDIDPRQLAYVMFTSGSTGVPKGVAVTHRNVVALAADRRFEGHDRVLSHSAFAFDASTYEVWVPLLNGGTVVVAPPGVLDAPVLDRLLRQERVTGAFLTTGLFNALAEGSPEVLAAVPELWTGGEAVSPASVGRVLAAGGAVTHVYGPTETTTFALSHRVTEPGDVVPIGGPLDNTRAHVLDAALRPVPAGVPGELYLAGDHLARGYLGRPGLTAERFVADPYGPPGTRMYRTGDVVRRRADGSVEFVGRADGQVKIRGFRVELGEIDTTMTGHPAVAQSVTLLREDNPGDKRLVTYLTVHHPVETDDLRHHAEQTLPGYMVPGALVVLDALPLTHNGKIDRDALPAPVRAETAQETQGPRTEAEELVAEVWAEVLGIERVGVRDDFFALGGNSLLAIRVAARIRAAVDLEIPVNAVFTDPTVERLADTVEALLINDIEGTR
ncbi:non-ribosomal peptide synthetase [Streptosporangium saharense]|uniref:Amino acid adenylation domain-containing protein n=1 Tax=Streptosporangium saharense TaxID=1706840 RepID=A0A7W7QUD1_9ACTN|nr:non-ribosomal peptide synthetase [Streptosporangium saharense]MBB4919911.1 amino acid adenylation domain-containing protein [Streptosporangium saharense]